MAAKQVRRTFLEPPRSGHDSYVTVTYYEDSDITLKIADCDRRVHLGFGFGGYNGRTKAQTLRKLAKLEGALADIRAYIENA